MSEKAHFAAIMAGSIFTAVCKMKKETLQRHSFGSLCKKSQGGLVFLRGKEYRSAVRSRELIHQAMLDLICEKNLNDITIKEVVDRAKINRSTFYAHYSNLGELVEEIEQELLSYLKDQISARDQAVSPELVAKQVIGLFNAYPQLQKKQADNPSLVAFMYRVFNKYLDMCMQVVPLSLQEDPSFRMRLQLVITLVFYGIVNCESSLWTKKFSYPQTTAELINLCGKL